MALRGEHGRAVGGSVRVYRALIRAYPQDIRGEYGEEMVRCFRDLCGDEIRGRGARGPTLLWARTLPELVIITLQERRIMFARTPRLPVSPTALARWGALCALLGGALGMAGLGIYLVLYRFVGFDSFLYPHVLGPEDRLEAYLPGYVADPLCMLVVFGLYGTLVARGGRPGRLAVAGAALGGLAAVLSVVEKIILNLRVDYGFWEGEPEQASLLDLLSFLVWQAYVWLLFVGLLLLAVAAFRARLPWSLRVPTLIVAASVVPVPVISGFLFIVLELDANDLRYVTNGKFYYSDFIAEFAGLVLLYLGSALLGWALLRINNADPLASPSSSTSIRS